MRLTSEGRYLGLFMFAAAHSLRCEVRILKDDKLWQIPEKRPPDSIITCALDKGNQPRELFYATKPIRDGEGYLQSKLFYFRSAAHKWRTLISTTITSGKSSDTINRIRFQSL